jgi:hypothetical protein
VSPVDARRRSLVLWLAQFAALGTRVRRILGLEFAYFISVADLAGVRRRPGSPTITGLLGNLAFAGQTGQFVIVGENLPDAESITFGCDGIRGTLIAAQDAGVSIEVTISPEMSPRSVSFTIRTPRGDADSRSSRIFLTIHAPSGRGFRYGYAHPPSSKSHPHHIAPRAYHRRASAIGGDLI